jgi:DNA segregation ATPase FtsK/SpoIIIE-like protein
MITHMATVNVTDMKKLIQVASVVAGVTENRTELSQKSQVAIYIHL